MGLFSKLFKDDLGDFIKNSSDDELDRAYEDRRLEWLANGQNGTGEITHEMKRISDEISRRSAERWHSAPRRNNDPNYRWTDSNRWDD